MGQRDPMQPGSTVSMLPTRLIASGREAVAIKRVGLCNDVDNDGGVLGQECFIVYFLPFKHLVHLREGATPICNLLSRHYLAGRRLHCASLDRLADHFSIGVELDAGESKVLQVEPSDKVEEPVYRQTAKVVIIII